jgi:hypothetical protein
VLLEGGDGLGDAGGRSRRAGLHGHHHVQREQVLHHEVIEDLAVILSQFLVRGVAEELDDLRLEAAEVVGVGDPARVRGDDGGVDGLELQEEALPPAEGARRSHGGRIGNPNRGRTESAWICGEKRWKTGRCVCSNGRWQAPFLLGFIVFGRKRRCRLRSEVRLALLSCQVPPFCFGLERKPAVPGWGRWSALCSVRIENCQPSRTRFQLKFGVDWQLLCSAEEAEQGCRTRALIIEQGMRNAFNLQLVPFFGDSAMLLSCFDVSGKLNGFEYKC